MLRPFHILFASSVLLFASCSSIMQPISQQSPVGMWAPDKGAMLTSLHAKLGDGHPSFRHLDAETLENLVDRTRVSWVFEPDHTYTMDFLVDLGIDQQRVKSSGSWTLQDGILKIVERENSSGVVDPSPIVGVFDGQAMHIEKDQLTVVLYRN